MKKKKQKTNFVKQQKRCYKCNGTIDELNDNFLKLITYYQGEVVEEVWFHLPRCWGDYNSDRVNARLTEMSKVGMNILNSMGMKA